MKQDHPPHQSSHQSSFSPFGHSLHFFIVLLVLVSGFLLLYLKSSPVVSLAPSLQGLQEVIHVAGVSSLDVSPDTVQATVLVSVLKQTALEAQNSAAEKSTHVIAALKKQGIAEKDIETAQYYLAEEKDYNTATEKYEFKGYRAEHTLKITTKDIEHAGALLDNAVAAGATGVQQISFTLSDEKQKQLQQQLLSGAVADARKKAQILASAAGREVGKAVLITESFSSYPPVYQQQYAMYDKSVSVLETRAAVPLQPTQLSFSATVSITFSLA